MIDISIKIVKCVTSGNGFTCGEIYPVVGWNNGIQICRTSEQGDGVIESFMSGGIGEGYYNAWDDSGKPSFDEVMSVNEEILVGKGSD